MGPDQEETAAYAILYRGFDHRHMKTICEALKATTLKDKFKRQLGRTSLSKDMREFAETFPVLQDLRHLADYDPAARFLGVADAAMAAFDRASPEEQTDVLALMMAGIRN